MLCSVKLKKETVNRKCNRKYMVDKAVSGIYRNIEIGQSQVPTNASWDSSTPL